jgi:hypothetical protein
MSALAHCWFGVSGLTDVTGVSDLYFLNFAFGVI